MSGDEEPPPEEKPRTRGGRAHRRRLAAITRRAAAGEITVENFLPSRSTVGYEFQLALPGASGDRVSFLAPDPTAAENAQNRRYN